MKVSRMIVLLCMIFGLSLSATNSEIVPPDKNIRLVFLGKVGAGKSTLINAFYNFANNIRWDVYPKLFPIPTQSQACNVSEYSLRRVEENGSTQDISEYTVRGSNYVLNLIDSPGYSDPRGVERDEQISADISRFLATVGEFNAICIVLEGMTNKVTIEQRDVAAHIKSLIPKNAKNRIFILLTNTLDVTPQIVGVIRSLGLPTDNIFTFDSLGVSQVGYWDYRDVVITEDRIDYDYFDDVLSSDDTENNIAGEGYVSDTQKKARRVRSTWIESKKSFRSLLRKARKLGKYSTNEIGQTSEIEAEIAQKIDEALIKNGPIEEAELDLQRAERNLEIAREACHNARVDKDIMEERLMRVEADIKSSLKDKLKDKELDLSRKREGKYSLTHLADVMIMRLDDLLIKKRILQEEIVELFLKLEDSSMSSVNFIVDKFFFPLIQNEMDDDKKDKLQESRNFYKDQIELYMADDK